MNRWFRLTLFSLAAIAVALLAQRAGAQARSEPPKDMPKSIVSIYHVAPGKHMDFLKWMADREAVDKEAGLPMTQWYAHTDGDSWDYVAVAPDTTSDQSKKIDEIAKKRGLKIGFAANIELRQTIASHTDTYTLGPVSASDLLAAAK